MWWCTRSGISARTASGSFMYCDHVRYDHVVLMKIIVLMIGTMVAVMIPLHIIILRGTQCGAPSFARRVPRSRSGKYGKSPY